MEEARKKLRLCLMLVVAAAVIIGAVYYFTDVRNGHDMSGGTLVREMPYNVPGAGNIAGRVSHGVTC